MINRLEFEQDMLKEVRVRQMHGSLYEGDNEGLEIAVKVFRNGASENLAGAIVGEIVRADGVLTIVNGSCSGNVATVRVPASCLAPGMIKIVIKNTVGTQKTTIWAGSGVVSVVNGEYIDPSGVIPDLSDYTALTVRIEEAAQTVSGLSVSTQLIAGDRYRCIVTKA